METCNHPKHPKHPKETNNLNDSIHLIQKQSPESAADINLSKNTILSNTSSQKRLSKLILQKILGYIFLLIVILISVLSSIWIKFIVTDVKPFCLTYINYSFLSLLIVISEIRQKIVKLCAKKEPVENEDNNLLEKTTDDTFSENFGRVVLDNKIAYRNQFHKISISLMVFWYLGNAFYNKALGLTSVSSSNTISNAAIVFIFIEKIIFFKSKCSYYKLVGLILCVVGIVLMGLFQNYASKAEQKDSTWGIVLLILGSLFYSFYATILKYYYKKHKHHFDMMEVFGYMGLYNMLFIPFFLIIINAFGIEDMQIPDGKSILYIFLNALIAGLISDLLQSYSITLLSPHIVSFGLTLTIPLSYLFDFFKHNIDFNLFYLFGTLLIFLACFVIFLENYIKFLNKKGKLQNIVHRNKV